MSSENRIAIVTTDHSHPRSATLAASVAPAPANRPWPVAGGPKFDLGVAVRAIRKYWLLIAVLGLPLGAAAAAAVWTFLPPAQSSACTVLLISSQQPFVFQLTPEAQLDAAVYRQRQQQAISSSKVLETTFANPKVADLPVARDARRVEKLERMIKVDFKLGQEFMRVTVDAESFDEALILVAAVKDAYLSEVVNKERSIWEQSVARREVAIKESEAAIAADRATLAGKLAEYNLTMSDAPLVRLKLQSAHELLSQRESELRRVRFNLRKLEAEQKIAGSRGIEPPAIPDLLVQAELERDHQYQQLQSLTREAEQKLAANKGAVRPGATVAVVEQVQNEVKAAKKAEQDYLHAAEPGIRSRLTKRFQDERKEDADRRKQQIDDFREWESDLVGQVEESIKQVATLSSASAGIDAIVNQIERREKQIADERDTIQRQRREVENAPSRVSMFEEPRVIPVDETRRRMKYAGMAGLAGLGLVAAGFVAREFARNRVSDPDQVSGLTLPILGALPDLAPGVRTSADRTMESLVAVEAIDTIRTMLLHAVASNRPKVLMVTSSVPGEGKTTLSSWLAASLARAGYRTLLVDGDLRRPSTQNHFPTSLGPGVADVLRGHATVRSCCCKVPDQTLWVLSAGSDAAEASNLLPKGGWQRLVQEARSEFDFVVVDSSPLLAVVDPMLMAQACDGVVLAVLRDVSRMDLLADATNRLRTLGIPIVGCVVHRAYRPPTRDYYYPKQPREPDPVPLTNVPPTAEM
jgi:capsular exopolysaccharide synthesis family protein